MMCDARCPRCGRRIGWSGRHVDRPACRCGHRPPQAELEALDRRIELILSGPCDTCPLRPGCRRPCERCRLHERRIAAGESGVQPTLGDNPNGTRPTPAPEVRP